MRNAAFYMFIILITTIIRGCERDVDNTKLRKSYQYVAVVMGKGLDCGDTYLIEMKKLTGEAIIPEGTYYADNLPSSQKVAGLKINLNARNPTTEELYVCKAWDQVTLMWW